MKYKSATVLLLFSLCSVSSWAQPICPLDGSEVKPKEVSSYKSFGRLPVLESGRIKPMDTYARNILLQFSGKPHLKDISASHWLARLMFAPSLTKDDKVFLVNNPSILEAIGVPEEKKRRYSFAQLQPESDRLFKLAEAAQSIDQRQRDVVENEIIRVYKNLKIYSSLSVSFAFAFPHPDFTIKSSKYKQALNLPVNTLQFSFLDVALRAGTLQELVLPLESIPSEQWDVSDQEIVNVVSNLFKWSMIYQNVQPQMIPSYMSGEEDWHGPWDAMSAGLQTEQGREELISLRDVMVAYWNGHSLDFDLTVNKFVHLITERSEQLPQGLMNKIKLEILYNQLNLFSVAKMLYLSIIFLFLTSLIIPKEMLRQLAGAIVLIAFIFHAAAITMRIIILQRPPVSNLYETFIFVGFVSVLVGIITEKINRQWIGLIISSICGFSFLTIASKFSAEGDTLQMLVAVLNSNFWLGTHVLSITAGYAGTCVAGVVGHIYILQSIFKSKDKKLLESTYRILIGTLGFALIMTFLGTNLGGIWADQSWGRFWGWDPKENGALMIILWTALIFHARIAKLIGPFGLAVGSVLGIIVVMWAWFGVNLLSVGLHSYGFTSGLAFNLALYCLCQLLFLSITIPLAKQRMKI